MRIIQVCSYFPSTKWMPYYGGIESYIQNLSKFLVKNGHNVTVITSKIPRNSPRLEHKEGIKIVRLTTPAIVSGFPLIPHLFFKLGATSKNADIIHAHINSPSIIEIAAFVSKISNRPLVVTYHADPIIQDLNTEASRYVKPILGTYLNKSMDLILKRAHKIIVTTPLYMEKSNFLQNYLHKVVVIPNSIDIDFFREQNPQVIQDLKREYNLKNNRIILFVGRLVKYKGIEYLLKAMKTIIPAFKNICLLIVGDGPLRNKLEYLSNKMNLKSNIVFTGNVSNRILRNIYRIADLFVLPSISNSEGFGIVLIEAMAHAKPVVASNVGGIPHIVKNGFNGLLVAPRNYIELGNKIIDLLSDDIYSQKLGQRGQEYITKNYSWQQTVRQIIEIYRNISKSQ
ncbi:MAG: glycosyltransferase family 4 protein [Promethearchaeota archaeon]